MAKLKITMVDGVEHTCQISPRIEYSFEQYKGKGFHKSFSEDGKQSDVYWLAWECLRSGGTTVPPFGEKFLELLKKVEVLDDDPLE